MPRRRESKAPLTETEVLTRELAKLRREVNQLRQAGVKTIHAIDKKFYFHPVQGEVEWHYPWYRAYVWHEEKWMPIEPPTYHIKVERDDKEVTTGDGKFKFATSRDMHQLYLFDAECYITTSGSVTVSLWNNTQSRDLLTTPMTVDSGEKHTRTAATKRVIHATNSQVNWGDEIWINVDAVGGSCMGLGVLLVFAAKPSIVNLNTHDG